LAGTVRPTILLVRDRSALPLEVAVSLNRTHTTVITIWFAALMVVAGVAVAAGVDVSVSRIIALVVFGCAPALVLVLIFKGAPQSVGQMLYETDHAASASEKRDVR
jgi:hypothetical protein